MSQHDFDIANQTAANARADINNALKALMSLSSGSADPSLNITGSANMPWYDTGSNTLKMRAEADDAWISIGYLNQLTDTFALFDNTQVVDSSGTQTGLLGDQAESVWETGAGTTESLVSPAKIKAAIEALAPSGSSYTDAEARTAQSGHSVGDVGSYAWLSYSNGSPTTATFNPGDTTGGSNLKYSGSGASSTTSPSGTWQCMGFISVLQSQTQGTLWLRIS